MNAEQQLIGSLLIDSSRIDEMSSLHSEMFTDTVLGKIFSIYQLADGKEVNQLIIIPQLKTDFFTEKDITTLLAELVTKHDPSISDKSCVKVIYDSYRARKLNELLDHSRISPLNINESLDEIRDTVEALQRDVDDDDGKTLSELTAYKDDYFKDKNKNVFSTGFSKIDKAIGGMDEGDVIILAARPAVGKSALVHQIARKFGKENHHVGYFNLEMGEKQIYERSVASTSGIDMTRIRLATNFLNDEFDKFSKANEELEKEKNVRVFSGSRTIETIRAKVKKFKFDVIIVDYLQLIKPTHKRQNRVSEVGDISRGLKAIASDFKIPVIALSQLNRASEMNKDKEPTMNELRESGDIEQDASVILMMWNPNADDLSEKKIKVEKSRNGYTDRETLYFDGKHMTFSTIDADGFRQVDDSDDLNWN